MAQHPLVSKKTAKNLSIAFFLVGLAIVTITGNWWPGLMLAVGIALAIRQYLLRRMFDMTVSLIVFLGVFFTVQFDISWQVVIPVLFTIGAIYLVWREYIENKIAPEDEQEEDLNEEIEEEQHKK